MPRSPRRALTLALTVVLTGCAARSAPPAAPVPASVATGPVTILARVDYRQRVALPPTAVVTLQLLDVARADAPARVLAEQTLSGAGQVPFLFSLRAPADAVAPPARVVLRARIDVDGQLRFTNTTTVPVPIPPPARPIDVVVQPTQ